MVMAASKRTGRQAVARAWKAALQSHRPRLLAFHAQHLAEQDPH